MMKCKLVTLFLIVFLLASLTFPFFLVRGVGSNWVTLQVNEIYVLRGETLTITTKSNSSQINLRIYSPSQQLIYDQIWNGNSSRSLPVQADAEYGTYTIEASTATSKSQVWVTVLDITNWSPVSFPYLRVHKGITYMFYANGTITASKNGQSLNVDLSTLRDMATQYGLTVTATYNSMAFRVRFTKTGIATVDMGFIFIHTGMKFVVNGTLDQPRSFSMSVSSVLNFKNGVDRITAGNLVYDWSDLRRTAHAFNFDADTKTLTINLPQTFSFDPTLFEADFETGDLSEFTGTEGSNIPTINTTTVRNGTYSMRSAPDINDQSDAYKSGLSASAILYEGFWFYVEEIPQNGGETFDFGGVGATDYQNSVFASIDYGGYWAVTYYVSAACTHVAEGTPSNYLGAGWVWTVICRDVTNSLALIYINDTLKINATVSNSGNSDIIWAGVDSVNYAGLVAFTDGVTVSTTYPTMPTYGGGDSTAPTYSGLSTSTTVAGASCNFNATWTDETDLSGYILSINNTGTWANETWTAFSTNPETVSVSKTLNSTATLVIGYNWYANDTSDNWNTTGIQTLTLTYIYITLQARDKDSANLPRAVTFSGSYSNGTTFSVTSSTSGSYVLPAIYGSLAVTTTWQAITAKASTNVTTTANATQNLDTLIAKVSWNTNYALVCLDGTSIGTPTIEGEADIMVRDIVASGSLKIVVDHVNWKKTIQPTRFEVGTRQYDQGDGTWSWASSVFSLTDTYDGTQSALLIFGEQDGGGGGGGGTSGSSPTPTPTPTEPPLTTVPTVPSQLQPSLEFEQPPIVAVIMGVCVVALIGIVIYVDQSRQSGWKKVKKNKSRKVDWKK